MPARESGDDIGRDVPLRAERATMASTHNMVGRPPLAAVKDARTRELVRPETIADLLSRDCG